MLRLWSWLGWVPFLEYERKRKAAERYAMAWRSASAKAERLEQQVKLLSSQMSADLISGMKRAGCREPGAGNGA